MMKAAVIQLSNLSPITIHRTLRASKDTVNYFIRACIAYVESILDVQLFLII